MAGGERPWQQSREIQDADAGERQLRCSRHSKRPSRNHFVATHFSPSTTGDPPCSVRVTGCGRS